ncbi:HNH endonuclease [Luteibacter aegosomaticola]|uniref:HNH endonuclease n=1 Tax=Luteibacter aegosomaticola TaxID=2911538 RepID=UPI001FF9AEEA|nr:HNH endonuclease signature motif containing protein [Luteibacter aegosomaticola]UPG91061.1 HNH endonuclease [Luteibacter aegosomaticola]
MKRAIRQRCGFGCVVCGSSVYEYEHIEPTYAEAQRHDPDCMATLCPSCHGKVTRKLWSKDRIARASADPFCKREGFSFETLDPGEAHPYIVFAGLTTHNTPIPVQVEDQPLMRIDPPEQPGAPHQISATFYDDQGRLALTIDRNEWRPSMKHWDVELVADRLTIRSAAREIALSLRFVAGGGIEVEQMNMLVKKWRLEGSRDHLTVYRPDGGILNMTQCVASYCKIGLQLGRGTQVGTGRLFGGL